MVAIPLSSAACFVSIFFFFQAEDGIRDLTVTGVQTCALPILHRATGGGRGGKHRELAPAEASDRVRRAALRLEDLPGVRDRYGWRRERRGMAEIGRASCRERV